MDDTLNETEKDRAKIEAGDYIFRTHRQAQQVIRESTYTLNNITRNLQPAGKHFITSITHMSVLQTATFSVSLRHY